MVKEKVNKDNFLGVRLSDFELDLLDDVVDFLNSTYRLTIFNRSSAIRWCICEIYSKSVKGQAERDAVGQPLTDVAGIRL